MFIRRRDPVGGLGTRAFQALQEKPVWDDVELITAVSGGSYIAGARQIIATESGRWAPNKPFAPLSPEERYLRNRTNYLAPGTPGKSKAASRWFRGFMWNVILLVALIWVTAKPTGWFVGSWFLYPAMREEGGVPAIRSSTWISLVALVSVALVVASVPQWRRFSDDVRRNSHFRFADYLLYAAAAIFVLQLAVPFALATARWFVEAVGTAAAWIFASASLVVTGGGSRSLIRFSVRRSCRPDVGEPRRADNPRLRMAVRRQPRRNSLARMATGARHHGDGCCRRDHAGQPRGRHLVGATLLHAKAGGSLRPGGRWRRSGPVRGGDKAQTAQSERHKRTASTGDLRSCEHLLRSCNPAWAQRPVLHVCVR